MAELRGLGAIQAELQKMGVRMIAVSVDSPAESAKVISRNKLPFPILSDANRTVIREYGLVHTGGGPGASEIAIPANILVDHDGKILWRHIATKVQDRADPDDLVAAVRRVTS